jgi:hypothetical protein
MQTIQRIEGATHHNLPLVSSIDPLNPWSGTSLARLNEQMRLDVAVAVASVYQFEEI